MTAADRDLPSATQTLRCLPTLSDFVDPDETERLAAQAKAAGRAARVQPDEVRPRSRRRAARMS